MITYDERVYVLSFELFRNYGGRIGSEGNYYGYYSGWNCVSIWDGILPNRNLPDEILSMEFKDVYAVVTERPFNYDYYTSPDKLLLGLKLMSPQRIYRVSQRTESGMFFIPESIMDAIKTRRAR